MFLCFFLYLFFAISKANKKITTFLTFSIDILKKLNYVMGMENFEKNTTANGFNVRITPKTMELLGKIKTRTAEVTGVNQPMSAIVGQLVHDKAIELGVADEGCSPV